MSGTSDNRRPALPGGLPQGGAGSERQVEKDLTDTSAGPGLAQGGLMWALAGGVAMLVGTDLACVFMAYGMGLALSDGRGGRRTALLVACLASVLVCVIADPSQIPYALVACGIAFAFSAVGTDGEPSTGRQCLAVLLGAGAIAAISATYSYLDGSSLPAEVYGAIDEYGKAASESAGAAAQVQIQAVEEAARTYWPMGYIASGLLEAVCSLVGARLAARKRGVRTDRTLSEFDVPLWVCVAFAVGAAASLAGSRIPSVPDQVRMVGENLLTAARIPLTLQGMAVLTWYLKRSGVGPVTRFLLLAIALLLEVSYIVMSVLGIVDAVAANFRGLPRKRGRSDKVPTR